MSHEVETMAWTNQVPWHGLGFQVSDDLTPEQMLVAAKIDWTVSKRKLYAGKIEIPNFFALMRDSDDQTFDVVGPAYVPTQNAEAFAFFNNFCKAGGAKMETAGALRGGKVIWGLAKIARVGPKGDPVDCYLLVYSPHQQGKTMGISMTAIRVVCQNTLRIALKNTIGEKFRHIHRREFNEEVQKEAAETIGAAQEVIDLFDTNMRTLKKVKIDMPQALDYLLDVFDERENEGDPTKIHSHAQLALEHAPGAELTAWGAFNAVTYVTDHTIGRSVDRRLERAWFGKTASLKTRAMDVALRRWAA